MNQAHKHDLAWNQRITEARERLGINKSEFARRVGVSTATTADWETGTIRMIDGDNLIKAASVLGVSSVWLMTGMTLIEQKLCRMWAATENSGDWWGLFQRLSEISEMMAATDNQEAAELFHEAAYIAIERCMYDIRIRVAA